MVVYACRRPNHGAAPEAAAVAIHADRRRTAGRPRCSEVVRAAQLRVGTARARRHV